MHTAKCWQSPVRLPWSGCVSHHPAQLWVRPLVLLKIVLQWCLWLALTLYDFFALFCFLCCIYFLVGTQNDESLGSLTDVAGRLLAQVNLKVLICECLLAEDFLLSFLLLIYFVWVSCICNYWLRLPFVNCYSFNPSPQHAFQPLIYEVCVPWSLLWVLVMSGLESTLCTICRLFIAISSHYFKWYPPTLYSVTTCFQAALQIISGSLPLHLFSLHS